MSWAVRKVLRVWRVSGDDYAVDFISSPGMEAIAAYRDIELTNNRAERSIKPFVMGRKNFLFCNTPRGATAAEVIYSLIETAKFNGLDPYEYTLYVLRTAQNLAAGDVDPLLPWNAPEFCKQSQS